MRNTSRFSSRPDQTQALSPERSPSAQRELDEADFQKASRSIWLRSLLVVTVMFLVLATVIECAALALGRSGSWLTALACLAGALLVSAGLAVTRQR